MENNIFYSSGYKKGKEGAQKQTPEIPGNGPGEKTGHTAEKSIDLNEQLVRNKPATFFMRVNSNAMVGCGIHQGDVVIVDRSIEAGNGKVVIALLGGEMLIRRLEVTNHKKRLLPATKNLSPIDIPESSALSIWGVVTYVIHSV